MSKRLSWAALLRSKSSRRPNSVRPLLEALEERLVPVTYNVNSLGDANSGIGVSGDLRYCITQADTNAGSTIAFDPTVFAAHQTITLGGTELPVITASLTITGPAAGVTVSGNHKSRVFEVGVFGSGNPDVVLSDLTVTQGHAGGTSFSDSAGGGLLDNSTGTLRLSNCTLSGNSASYGGGLLNERGKIALVNVTLAGNSAAGDGGGLYNHGGGTVTLTNATLAGNSAPLGGGLENYGTATLVNCTLAGNSAYYSGGGLYNNGGAVTLTNATLAGNSAAGDGGGLFSYFGTARLTNTLVAGNSAHSAASDIVNNKGTISGDYDLTGDGSAPGSHSRRNVANPGLAPLGNYGGPTSTRALLPGSPALDAGAATGVPVKDQRGKARVGAVDIGAFESQGFTLTAQGGDNQQVLPNTALQVPFAVRVTAKNALEPVQGGLVSFTAPSSGPSGTFPGSSLTATAPIRASGVATAPPFTTTGTLGSFTVAAAAKGGNAVHFHVQVVAAAVVNGNLVVVGTTGNDVLIVNFSGTQFRVHVNGVSYTFAASLVTGRVIVSGYAGNDTITLIGKFPAEVHAGAGSDLIHGGDGGNVLYGGSGSLTAYAGAGDDVLIGGSGKATLYGGKGKAVLIGGSIKAGMGFDTYDALAKLAANWAAGDTSQEAALKAAIAAGAADALHAGTGGTWGFAAAAGDFIGFKAGRDRQTLLT